MDMYGVKERYERLQEYPFSSDHKLMAVRCIRKFGSDQEKYYVKGALERLLPYCASYSVHGSPMPLTKEREMTYFKEGQYLGRKGLRVLAMAVGSSMENLTFLGMVGILDPPRPGVREAIETLVGSGVAIKMLTGDSEDTACAIGARLGLYASGNMVVSGEQLDMMSDAELQSVINSISVFYRVSPGHKLRIVKVRLDFFILNFIILVILILVLILSFTLFYRVCNKMGPLLE